MTLNVNLQSKSNPKNLAASKLPLGFFIADSVVGNSTEEVYEDKPHLYFRKETMVHVFDSENEGGHYYSSSNLTFYNVRIPKTVNITVEE
jgi:catabolite regulation protein CreA